MNTEDREVNESSSSMQPIQDNLSDASSPEKTAQRRTANPNGPSVAAPSKEFVLQDSYNSKKESSSEMQRSQDDLPDESSLDKTAQRRTANSAGPSVAAPSSKDFVLQDSYNSTNESSSEMQRSQDDLPDESSLDKSALWRTADSTGPSVAAPSSKDFVLQDSYNSTDEFFPLKETNKELLANGTTKKKAKRKEVNPAAGDEESDSLILIDLKPPNPVLVQKVSNQRLGYYRIAAKPRGKVVILNNEKFKPLQGTEKKLRNRNGSSYNVKNLTNIFTALEFQVKQWPNCSSEEIKKKIYEERTSDYHLRADAFVFIILSHGTRGSVYGTDCKKVLIEEEIIGQFDGNNCPKLAGKPKLFFIQACQGDETTVGVTKADVVDEDDSEEDDSEEDESEEDDSEEDDSEEDDSDQNEKEEEHEEQTDPVPNPIHPKADVLRCISTVPGFKSRRSRTLGSWFIRFLVMNINKYAHRLHICDILTKVRYQLHERQGKGGNKQLAETTSTLLKTLYFFPKS